MSEPIDIEAMERAIANDTVLTMRTNRIVDRVWPMHKHAPHGFYQPDAFMARLEERSRRSVLWHKVKARLRAKAEGGLPRIKLPRNASHVTKGSAMEQAARELEREFPA